MLSILLILLSMEEVSLEFATGRKSDCPHQS